MIVININGLQCNVSASASGMDKHIRYSHWQENNHTGKRLKDFTTEPVCKTHTYVDWSNGIRTRKGIGGVTY